MSMSCSRESLCAWSLVLLAALVIGCGPDIEPTVRECHPPGTCKALLKKPIQEKKLLPFTSAGGDASAGQATWRELCVICHGEAGKGGMAMGGPVPDITSAHWQSRAKDAEIADVILHGKGRMPSFTLEEKALRDLVRHIRTLTVKTGGY